MKSWLILAGALLLVLLTGCANAPIRSEVLAFHEWTATMADKSFVFSHTAAQENDLEYRNYEKLVRNELLHLNFVPAPNKKAANLEISLQYFVQGRDVRVMQPVMIPYAYDPYFYPARWHGRGYYRQFYDPYWDEPPLVAYQEVNYPVFTRYLRVMISRINDGKQLFDVKVRNEGRNANLAAIMPYLVHNAFTGFPGKSGVPVYIELTPQN